MYAAAQYHLKFNLIFYSILHSFNFLRNKEFNYIYKYIYYNNWISIYAHVHDIYNMYTYIHTCIYYICTHDIGWYTYTYTHVYMHAHKHGYLPMCIYFSNIAVLMSFLKTQYVLQICQLSPKFISNLPFGDLSS